MFIEKQGRHFGFFSKKVLGFGVESEM